ncbi:60S ribosomal protein L31 [Diplonema papillatum]|nr:60S ribosomal protein L31 [Diplonema papillatum]KAJ9467445.1 60S ribosomal protein L31 [Diplonema papillatum]
MVQGYKPKNKKETRPELITVDTTIHMHKYLKGRTFKKRAPFATKVVRRVAKQLMGTEDNRIEVRLNKAIWAGGVKGCPTRIRVRIERKKNDDEDAKHPLYTVCSYIRVPRDGFRGLLTQRVSNAEE